MERLQIMSRLHLPTVSHLNNLTDGRITLPPHRQTRLHTVRDNYNIENPIKLKVVDCRRGKILHREQGHNFVTPLGLYKALTRQYVGYNDTNHISMPVSYVDGAGNTYQSLPSEDFVTQLMIIQIHTAALTFEPSSTDSYVQTSVIDPVYVYGATNDINGGFTISSNNFAMSSPASSVLSLVIPGPLTFYGFSLLDSILTSQGNYNYNNSASTVNPISFTYNTTLPSSSYASAITAFYAPSAPIDVAQFTSLSFQYTQNYIV